MSLIDALRRVTGDALREAFTWLGLNIFLIGLPIGIAYLIMLKTTGQILLQSPISHGELLLVSILLLGSGIYTTIRGMKVQDENSKRNIKFKGLLSNINFPGNKIFNPIIFLETLAAMVFYIISLFPQNTNISNYQQIQLFWNYASFGLLVFCIGTSFLISLVEYVGFVMP